MHNHRKLSVYRSSLQLAKQVYEVTKGFPASERFNLTDQLRRCAVSVPSNIAEGCGRSTNLDTARFISNSIGSSYEIETQLDLAKLFGYTVPNEVYSETLALQRSLCGFRNHLLGNGR